MPINGHELARMTDLTMIDQLATKADMEALIANAKKYDTWVAVGLKCYVPMLVEGLKGTNTMVITGCSSRQGSDELETKISAAKRYIDLGIGEIENFMNYSYFKSKMYDEVVKDIRAIRDVAGDMTYKVILETPQFNGRRAENCLRALHRRRRRFCKNRHGHSGRNGCPHHRSDLQSAEGPGEDQGFGRHPDAGNRGRDAGSGRCPLWYRHEQRYQAV